MLSESDLKRLDFGASRMVRQGLFLSFALVGLAVVGIGSEHIWLATNLADFAHVGPWELFRLKFDLRQSYSGAIVLAANHLSTGVRAILEGLVLVSVAFLFRVQAKFYARLRSELPPHDA